MKLTPSRLRFYAEIASECRLLAVEFNEVVKRYDDLQVDEFEDVYVDMENELIQIEGSYSICTPDGYTDYQDYSIQIPFAFIEDPLAWQDQWEEAEHQKTLDKIQAKIDKKKRDADELEAFDRKQYERLKEKYGGGQPIVNHIVEEE